MRGYQYDHVHLRSPDPDATARFFETMFGAEVTRSVYPPGTLYPGQQRITIRLGGQKVLIAPPHPHDPNAPAPPFPYYGLEHIGLTVDDLDAAVEELRAEGVEIAIGPLTRNPGLRLGLHPRTRRHHDRARAAVAARRNSQATKERWVELQGRAATAGPYTESHAQ
jgi:catechol 2,3-dioxygenase-like lactoylglutathione lyase family enzyme